MQIFYTNSPSLNLIWVGFLGVGGGGGGSETTPSPPSSSLFSFLAYLKVFAQIHKNDYEIKHP